MIVSRNKWRAFKRKQSLFQLMSNVIIQELLTDLRSTIGSLCKLSEAISTQFHSDFFVGLLTATP